MEEDGGAREEVVERGKVGVGGGESGVGRRRGGGAVEVERSEVGLQGGERGAGTRKEVEQRAETGGERGDGEGEGRERGRGGGRWFTLGFFIGGGEIRLSLAWM